MHDYNHYNQQLSTATARLKLARHRQLLLICGSVTFCYEAVSTLFPIHQPQLRLSQQLPAAIWPEHLHQILGQEWPLAIYDGFAGVVPNKLSALSGTVAAGGLLVLLLPELSTLATFRDPALALWCSAEHTQSQSPFLMRWQQLFQAMSPWLLSERDGLTLTMPTAVPAQALDFRDQQACINKVVTALQHKRNLPVLINADRGRGKSSALGLIAKALPEQNFILCAQQHDAVHSVFKHLGADNSADKYPTEFANIRFMPPDQVLAQRPSCDMLLVDEAAAIPVAILQQLLGAYPNAVFASTIIGYEGNGRGYTLKFMRLLAKQAPNHQVITLNTPIRYAAADPLEHSINHLFALDSQYPDKVQANQPTFKELTTEQLCRDETQLQQLFALLVLAHYQTSVNDLRQLLDTPNQRIYILESANTIVAACVVAIEGGLSSDLSQAIASGSRRPRGHLLAQQLTLLTGDATWCQRNIARIVRVAVAPTLQGQGLGSILLSRVEAALMPEVKLLGSSFGAQSELVKFWFRHDYQAIKLGYRADKASGEHSLLVVKPLATQELLSVQTWQQQFHVQLPYQLLTYFKQLNSDLVLSLWQQRHSTTHLAPQEILPLPLAKAASAQLQPVLWQFACRYPEQLYQLSNTEQLLIVRFVLQGWCSSTLVAQLSLSGKKQFEQMLNDVVQKFLHFRVKQVAQSPL
ncbi:GNAT family N-acetyltransferase [Pseudoalteromonas fenneropenaei]|uniref:tRNA(Met) cytidine acetyltransferase TmcA n=1 Tax=Pseudoalteromonas fenneropenaei TaxID=1737459 RepID=A0ABV7CR83_9GAMM